MVVDVREPAADPVLEPDPAQPARRWWLLAGALVAAWVVPLALHVVRADLVAALLVWVGTAALLRSGRSAVDRLVIASGLLLGVAVAAGMLFSVWPWGLHPVPVAGTTLTALVLVAGLTGRRPVLPRRFDLSDALLVALTVGVGALMSEPLRGGSQSRMALVGRGEDGARHFALFDYVLRSDGYVYFHGDRVGGGLQEGFETYPQGTHMVMALAENFLRAAADPLTRFDHFVFMYAGWFAFATACLLWAARHVLGPGYRNLAFAPYAVIVAGYFFLGDGIPIFLHGFVSEIAAIGPYALLIALLVRPLRDMREQIVVVAALLGALSMIYYLFLLSAVPVVLVWLVARRRDLLRYWRWSVPAVLLGGALTVAAPLLNLGQAGSAEQLIRDGGIEPVNTNLLTVLIVAVAVGLLASRAGQRSPAWRMVGVWLLGTLLYLAALYVYSVERTGATHYYFGKALHQVMVVGLVGVGAIGLLVPRRRAAPGARRRDLARQRLTGEVAAVAVAVLAATAMAQFTSPYKASFGQPPIEGVSWGAAYARRELGQPIPGAAIIAAYRKLPPGDLATVNIVYVEGVVADFTNYNGTLWLSVLIGNNGRAWRAPLWLLGPPKTEDDFVNLVKSSPDPIRLLTNSPKAISAVERIRRDDPGRRVDLVALDYPR